MKIKIPAKEIEACDICGRDGNGCLTTCVVCGKRYCFRICEAIMVGCVHQPNVCKECGRNEKVEAVVEQYAKPLWALLKKRDAAMKRAGG